MVKIFDLEREYREIKEPLAGIFDRVCRSGEFILGKEVKAFEEAFARYIGVHFAAGVGSGTDAIRIGGLGLGLKPGDKIVTTPNTYVATVMALSVHGIIPVFCDIDPETCNMDPGALRDVLRREKGVKVCIPVHLYGHPCQMDEILDVCSQFDVTVFEDACQAHGALFKGRKVGTFGKAAAFSFYPTKNLGAYGDAGGIVTADRSVYDQICRLRNYGQPDKHVHVIEGFNSRLDELQAAILSFKLSRLDSDNEKRRHLADIYRWDLENETPVGLPVEKPWARHVYHLFVIRTRDREDLGNYLKARGIGSLIHYPTPIHLQEAYQRFGFKKGAFPEAEKAASEILSLPIYPGLTEEEAVEVSTAIRKFYSR
ncbi:MAG: dTDP-3-amino-3,6-dideoxy-alpha-D-galactopyranose transaminase [Syntrophorhabdaceae bacterium PtaU1.Bin034]|nr:MAG: dTDP-3-amino-3,6-dideoxy-alpha-D-galactopyranose transaminase [Syntrophorhabdaceae bacterium PtaU1.Bin034]